ncbi:MFS transporter [Pseudonocardia spinosispora]|uniref:MFS transporter n=1 Tax=Pseudonocardia spinosispora TaxID=103441 RepID=UPI000416C223|nr:MFS transporter [Pseudonocardia spinosispora]
MSSAQQRSTDLASEEPTGKSTGEATGEHGRERLGLRALLGNSGFFRLLLVRFTAQWGDGMFQAALGGAVLFNPERQADPMAVAVGVAVLFLPYSIIGPFAGALLDRWDRRRVLWAANLVRAVCTVGVAVLVATGVAGAPLYLGALAVTGVTRFVLAGLSAALPHVVKDKHLVEANVVAATAGAAIAAIGAGCAIALRGLCGTGNFGSAIITVIASAGGIVAALIAVGFGKGALGPDEPNEARRALVAIARGLADGARATVAARTVASSFIALICHRLAFGVCMLLMLLLFRHEFTAHGFLLSGMGGIGEMVGAGAAGLGAAALVTPWLAHRLGRPGAIRVALLLCALTSLVLAFNIKAEMALVGAFVLTGAGQIVKLCADSSVQSEVHDDARGRVFALYDAVFNMAYVIAVIAAALLSPPEGHSPLLLAAAGACYLVGLTGHELVRRVSRR